MKRLPKPTASRRKLNHRPATTRYSSTSPPTSIDALRSRPPKFIPDYLTPTPSNLLATTISDLLGKPAPSPTCQSPARHLPQGHHLVYFPIQTAPSKLAPDGADPDHSPGSRYPRRMWAGGEVTFRAGWDKNLVLDGRRCLCREEIGGVDVRADGKVFVHVWRRYGVGEAEAWDIEERRTLVFMRRDDGASGGIARRAVKFPRTPTYSARITPSAAHLFHFSALTFNAHYVHIDASFARSDGHKDLLVHGPLILALMLDALGGNVAQITYRNYAPLYVNNELTVCVGAAEDPGRAWSVWVEGPDGGMAVKGTAMMEPKE